MSVVSCWPGLYNTQSLAVSHSPHRGHGLVPRQWERQVEVAIQAPSVPHLYHCGRWADAHSPHCTRLLWLSKGNPCCAARTSGDCTLALGTYCSICQVHGLGFGFCGLSFLLLPRRVIPCLKVYFLPSPVVTSSLRPLLLCETVTLCLGGFAV